MAHPEKRVVRDPTPPMCVDTGEVCARNDFDNEVRTFLNDVMPLPPEERQFFIARHLRKIEKLSPEDFGDKLDVLKEAVRRGNLLIDLQNAKAVLDMADRIPRMRRRV